MSRRRALVGELDPGLPPYAGVSPPLDGPADGEPPLVQLVRKLYTSPVSTAAYTPLFDGSLDVFPKAHEDAILREPWTNEAGASTRACLMGDSCVGKSALIPGHEACPPGGVLLTEEMTPRELADFEATGAVPAERRTCLLCARYNIHAAYLFARKQRTFPSNCLLNHFMNAAGENEYAKEYLVPTADDSAWSGVCGTVVGLHLNALRLVQNADRSWRVDQSAMAHVTRTPCNVTFPPLYRSLMPTPEQFLRHFFAHRTGVSDATVLFYAYTELSEARPKIPPTPTEAFLKWPARAVKSFPHRLLHYRVNRLNVMLNECAALYGQTWAYNMQLYIDAHIGMVLLFERGEMLSTWSLKYTAHQHILPDLVPLSVQAAVNSVVPDGLSVCDRKSELSKPNALAAQMLIRALPEFSQTRWLHKLFIKCLQNRELSATMFAIAQAALLGNYVHATDRAPWETRKALVEGFTQRNAAEFFLKLPTNEHLVLYIMGTYVLTVLPLCPALDKLVAAMSPFKSQEARVFDAMRAVRQAGRGDWRLMFSTDTLDALKKTHKRMPKRKIVPRGLADCSNVLCVNTKRTASQRGLKRPGGAVAFDPQYFSEQVKRARLGLPPPEELSRACGRAADAVLGLADGVPNKKPTLMFSKEDLSDADLERLFDFAAATDHARLARLTPLPDGFVRRQVAAVARRFGCAEDELVTLQRAKRIAICVSCGVRNFYLTQAERGAATRRVDNVRAAGYRKLALNLATNELRCVATESCVQHPLTFVDLAEPSGAGGVLVLRSCSLALSPCCGHVCATSSMRVTAQGPDCPCCSTSKKEAAESTPDPRLCEHCGKRSQLKQALEQTVLLRDESGRIKKYGFCKTHMRQWARTASGYLSFDFVSRNMMNRSGNGLVLDPT